MALQKFAQLYTDDSKKNVHSELDYVWPVCQFHLSNCVFARIAVAVRRLGGCK